MFSSDQIRDSLASVEADVNGFVLRSLQNFKWSDEVDPDLVYANSSVPIGAPQGMFKGEGSFQVIPTEWMDMVSSVGDQWSQVTTNIGVTLNQIGGAGITPVTFAQVRLTKADWDLGEAGGSKPAFVTVNFKMLAPPDYAGIASVRDNAANAFSLPSFLGL